MVCCNIQGAVLTSVVLTMLDRSKCKEKELPNNSRKRKEEKEKTPRACIEKVKREGKGAVEPFGEKKEEAAFLHRESKSKGQKREARGRENGLARNALAFGF